ncbi:TRAP transporter substrate-binding protein [Gracilibacillus salinarum]|uniref:TRAP transporter substrate-binding protein n=1 Tax=Gracilibacillus salinarum TaxID=2932255 RepID=A0ABY4GJH3_9BACI|nr:TRAP transporter substrate-binding protein [Gracilibacillus salinarum]UOQ84490.1 TRAP transporter substrate-binding protein [Gracilibacillus salinarum]
MLKNKKYLLLISICLLFVLAACGGNDAESEGTSGDAEGSYDPITITFSHNQPVDSPEDVGAQKFKELVEEKTDGQVTVEVFPASQLGSLREQVEGTQIGEIDITMQPSAVVSPFVDDIKAVDLPYLWPADAEQMYEVLDSEVGDELLGTLEQGGFKGLGFWPGGYKLFTTNGIEIHEPSDFEGVTMRTMESPILLAQYEEWGGNPIPVPYAELYNSLQQGVVDGQENPLQTIYLNNFYEVQDTVIESYHGGMNYVLMANQAWFDGLPAEVQDVITESEEEARNTARQSLADTEEEYRQKIIDSGVTYYELTPEEIEVFREASLPIHEEHYSEGDQQELLQKIYDKIDEVTAE